MYGSMTVDVESPVGAAVVTPAAILIFPVQGDLARVGC